MSSDHAAYNAVLRKVDWHLLPALCWLTFVTSLNATNIGLARIEGMERDLDLHNRRFSIAVLVFFIPLVLVDVPANIAFRASRPSRFLFCAVMMLGVFSVIEGLANSYLGLVLCRLFLGVCSTAFYAGSIYLTACYYPRARLHVRMSALIACRVVSSGLGGALAYAFAHLDGVAGYSGWSWIFIMEGILAVASAPLALSIPLWPAKAAFLSSMERETLFGLLQVNANACPEKEAMLHTVYQVARNPVVYTSAIIQFSSATITSSSVAFLPSILREFGWSSTRVEYMTIPVYLTAATASILNGFASDRFGRRYPFCLGPLLLVVSAFSVLLASRHVNVATRYAACFLAEIGNVAVHALSVVWLSNNITNDKERGVALGMAAGIGNCGFFLGSNIYLNSERPWYPTGFGINLGMCFLAIVAATCQLWYLIHQKRLSALHEQRVLT